MFRSEDLLFQIFSNPNIPSHQNKLSEDLFSDHNNNNNNNNYIYSYPPLDATTDHHGHHYTATAANSSRKRLQRDEVLATTVTATATAATDSNKLKRIMHREIERQRRQEMATLYSSLRSLLPVEYVKGKRSTSDHMHEALNYIKHMQKSIQELGRKRDRLKAAASSTAAGTSGFQDLEKNGSLDKKIVTAGSRSFVSVSRCRNGIEVLISFDGGGRGRFPLSRVLRTLENGGFDVVSCHSSTVDNRLLHRLQSEVSDEEGIDLQALQQKLTDVINL